MSTLDGCHFFFWSGTLSPPLSSECLSSGTDVEKFVNAEYDTPTESQIVAADGDAQLTAVFASDHVYVLPGTRPGSTCRRARASVLSKAVGTAGARRHKEGKYDG